MKRTSRYNSRLGRLMFFIPAIIIIILVVYAYVQLNSPGTLVVSAEDQNLNPLGIHFIVNGNNLTTPASVRLAEGSYVVSFDTIKWYYTPASREVVVTPGQTVYAVGSYQPITKFIQVTGSGFNVTSELAYHGLTPVTWKNPSTSLAVFSGGPFQQVRVDPGQSYTYVFPTIGSFQLRFGSTNETLTIDVV
jgi:hypothetical protein